MKTSRRWIVTAALAAAGLCAVVALLAVPVLTADPAAAETGKGEDLLDRVKKLLASDVDEEVIVRFIEQHEKPAELTAGQIVELKKAGASGTVILALMGGGGGRSGGQFPFDLDETHRAPATHKLLAIYPILREGPSEVGDYLTLDEANERKVIEITEKGGGSVPVVVIRNTSDMPIYICAGEIIIGGKQDRMVAYDILIKPRREVTVNVRCVEQGRWHGRKMAFRSGAAFAGSGARSAVQFESQTRVWKEVAKQNSAAGVRTSTGTLKATLDSGAVERRYREYREALTPALRGRTTVGMVVAMNGKVVSIDIFANPALFAKVRDKLLKAAVLDTLGREDEKADPPGREQILSFYREAMAAEKQRLKDYEHNANVKRESRKAMSSESVDEKGTMLHRFLKAK